MRPSPPQHRPLNLEQVQTETLVGLVVECSSALSEHGERDCKELVYGRPPAGCGCAVGPSDVAEGREHPGVEVVQQMAMDCPKPGVVGVEGDDDPAAGRHEHGVAYCAGKALAVDFDDLKFVSVQVHGMRHRRLVDEDEFDALALGDR